VGCRMPPPLQRPALRTTSSMKKHSHKSSHATVGFALIEAMIAIVILSIGMLGIATLMTVLIQRNSTSVYHTVAAAAAADIMEKIRANPDGYNDGAGGSQYLTNLSAFGAAPSASSAPACETSSCTANSVAQYDAAAWSAMLARTLPSGKGVVCVDDSPDDGDLTAPACGTASANSRVVVKVFWDESRTGGRADGTSTVQRYITTFLN
jgi:type IV pilus assembly protein PilV